MAGNKNLNSAARAKKDKFYTQLEDIENEVHHYKDFFKDKIVLCNCDDPIESQFFVHFACLFNHYELKKLIVTSYADSPIAGKEINLFPDGKTAYKLEVTEFKDWNGDGAENWDDLEYAIKSGIYKTTPLEGDEKYCAGDFRSKECLELLKEADVVVTNPPFSVFREFVATLIDYDKKFLIIGNINSITYKEIFPLIMQNKMWLGYGMGRAISGFTVPDDYELYGTEARIDAEGNRIVSTNQCLWYTNIETPKRFWDIPLWAKYSPEKNPRYDNYDAIEVSKTAEIPVDYFGVMGVPITFLDKYNPDQFEIIGLLADKRNENPVFKKGTPTYLDEQHKNYVGAVLKGKATYARILIRRRKSLIEIESLRKYFAEDKIFFKEHAAERFRQRGINIRDIRNAVNFGEIIEQYPDDNPYPSCLILGENLRGQNIHAVLSDEGTASRIITAYFPDVEKWSEDFKIRR